MTLTGEPSCVLECFEFAGNVDEEEKKIEGERIGGNQKSNEEGLNEGEK